MVVVLKPLWRPPGFQRLDHIHAYPLHQQHHPKERDGHVLYQTDEADSSMDTMPCLPTSNERISKSWTCDRLGFSTMDRYNVLPAHHEERSSERLLIPGFCHTGLTTWASKKYTLQWCHWAVSGSLVVSKL